MRLLTLGCRGIAAHPDPLVAHAGPMPSDQSTSYLGVQSCRPSHPTTPISATTCPTPPRPTQPYPILSRSIHPRRSRVAQDRVHRRHMREAPLVRGRWRRRDARTPCRRLHLSRQLVPPARRCGYARAARTGSLASRAVAPLVRRATVGSSRIQYVRPRHMPLASRGYLPPAATRCETSTHLHHHVRSPGYIAGGRATTSSRSDG